MNLKQSQKNNLKYVKELRKKETNAEKIVKKYLKDNKVRHIFQKGFLTPFHRIVDFYIPKKKIIIEIDGEIHNTTILKDKYKDIMFWKERKMKTLRVKNSQVYDGSYKQIVSSYLQNR